jgi:hypothetical protein
MIQHPPIAKHSEQGFALYLAIGFIVLISVLVGSVGTRLNVTALAEARRGDARQARDQAEQSLSEAYGELRRQYPLFSDPAYLQAHSEIYDAALSADHEKCVLSHEADGTGYKSFARTPNAGDTYRRYFIKRDDATYRLYGCGFSPKGTRIAYGEYDDDGGALSLVRLRRY